MKIQTLAFLLVVLLACQKPKTDPDSKENTCLIQKVLYDDGIYELYKFDANDRLLETTITYEDNGNIVEIPVSYEYNAAGNLLKSSTPDGWTDNYVYDASGLLTRVDFKDEKGQIDEQFTVTMDARKRITQIVSKKDELTGTYEYNKPNGELSKIEVKWEGKVINQYIISEYDSDETKKSSHVSIKGHPFDPAIFTGDIIYSPPFNFGIEGSYSLPTKGKLSTLWNEDWSNLSDKLRVYYDFTATRKFNSNNYVIERASTDAISNQTYIKTYIYSNCN